MIITPTVSVVNVPAGNITITKEPIRPNVGEKFTEFYILGLEDKAIDYPTELMGGEERRGEGSDSGHYQQRA